jgi:hypothetical protein
VTGAVSSLTSTVSEGVSRGQEFLSEELQELREQPGEVRPRALHSAVQWVLTHQRVRSCSGQRVRSCSGQRVRTCSGACVWVLQQESGSTH